MNFEPLNKFFKNEAMTSTSSVLVLPSGITKTLAIELVAKLPFEPIIRDLAIIMAKEVGTQMVASSLRPPDYDTLRDLPDGMIEKLIELLASKPELFFKTFQATLKIQG